MTDAKYDNIVDTYKDAILTGHNDSPSVLDIASHALIDRVGDVAGLRLLDIGCGTGTLALYWAERGASVTGVDNSAKMLERAQSKVNAATVRWLQDDARSLSQLADTSFDLLTSCFALMDIPDLTSVYQSAYRVLKRDGRFVFAITHPCFESPHSELLPSDSTFEGRRIVAYAEEGYWKSTLATGIRGRVGAHHRSLSTYINQLIAQGFTLTHIAEPTLTEAPPDNPYREMMLHIPLVMLLEARKL